MRKSFRWVSSFREWALSMNELYWWVRLWARRIVALTSVGFDLRGRHKACMTLWRLRTGATSVATLKCANEYARELPASFGFVRCIAIARSPVVIVLYLVVTIQPLHKRAIWQLLWALALRKLDWIWALSDKQKLQNQSRRWLTTI